MQLESALRGIHCKVSDEMNLYLVQEFFKEDVKNALFQMGPTKSLGLDDFLALFFQKHWELVKDKVIGACLEILNRKASIRRFNDTNITLIPKKSHPLEALESCPINLCSVVYKIVAKVLANRMKVILLQVISKVQSSFIPRRLITDNVLISQE